jgi:hypothetical protein
MSRKDIGSRLQDLIPARPVRKARNWLDTDAPGLWCKWHFTAFRDATCGVSSLDTARHGVCVLRPNISMFIIGRSSWIAASFDTPSDVGTGPFALQQKKVCIQANKRRLMDVAVQQDMVAALLSEESQ